VTTLSFETYKFIQTVYFLLSTLHHPKQNQNMSILVDEEGNPIAVGPPHIFDVANVCAQNNIPFVGVFGIVAPHPSADLALTPEDQQRMMATASDKKNASVDPRVYEACKSGDLAAVKQFRDVDFTKPITNLQQYAVQVAAWHGQPRVLEYLLRDLKLDPNVVSFSGKRALHYAAANLHDECVKLLLEAKANAEFRDHRDLLPIQCVLPADVTEVVLPDASMADRLRRVCQHLESQLQHAPKTLQAWLKKDAGDAKAKDDGQCAICLERPADTMVLPCEHCVVCKTCSLGLRTTPDAKECIRCRRKIEHVLE
jgi:hypothetical protein